MNKPKQCVRCGCSQRYHDDDGCVTHLKCKTTESRFFTERKIRSKVRILATHEVKNRDE